MNKPKRMLRIGGVLRCTAQTLCEATDEECKEEEGNVLTCKWCSQSLIFHNGAWEWNQDDDKSAP